ncbi:sensor histidine kinase [Catellatospora citrea]|uniref:sensor histidine kinase n=1 Tax=Catellatospora citrea TaxID=53366 RepID=UPI00340A4A7A
MPTRRVLPAAIVGATAAAVGFAWTCWFAAGYTLADSVDAYLLTNSALAVTFGAFGALVLGNRPRHPIGALFAGIGVCYALSLVGLAVISGVFELSAGLERAVTLASIAVWTPGPAIFLPLIIQLFPDGQALSRRWRVLIPVTVVAGVGFGLAMVLDQSALTQMPIADTRPVLGGPAGAAVAAAAPAAFLATAVTVLLSLIVMGLRLRRSRGVPRLQLLWLLWAVAVFVVLNTQRILTTDGPVLLLLTLPLIPAAATVAIVRHQLYDIRLVINRSIVYALLSVGVVGGYLAVIAVLSPLAGNQLSVSPVVATGVIAVAFAPARGLLQTTVDKMMYGRRRDPADAAATVGVHLSEGLGVVVRAVREALRLPYAAVVSGEAVMAEDGDSPTVRHAIALDVGDGEPADLVVGLRGGETAVSAADVRALHLLASPVGVALQAVRLTAQLRESRATIVSAREEERRRLRRDLHDGLGTALTAVTLKADAAHNLRSADPDRAAQLVLDIRADLTAAIADIRRLVYELRPPDLDELGLIGALRQRAEQSWPRVGTGFVVTVDSDPLPSLPAAIEVAAYRIATEAVTNALRHAGASRCRVALWVDGDVHVEVSDNGGAADRPWRPGVGLRSMHERATELGGTVTAGPVEHGGRVYARLPLVEQP